MEPVSEDTIKEVGWRDMPLFNRDKWISAVLLYAGLFYLVCYFGGSFMYIGTMSEEEKMLAEK